jgi:4-hydroxy-3-polyprenylbenzoate decarboxylase
VTEARRIVVAVSGASGAIYGVRLVEVLAERSEVESHLILSASAETTVRYETGRDPDELRRLADAAYDEHEMAAPVASGSFLTSAMVVAPCSMRTLSGVANSANDNLIVRAADVHLKERRPLVLLVRETPLHAGHLRLMAEATAAGAVILPPVPGFYTRPRTIADIVDHTLGKVLDLVGIHDHGLFPRWTGPDA